METNRAEELVKKIQELEAKYTHLKQEMSKLISTDSPKSKSEQSDHPHFVVSPQRSRLTSPMGETSGRFEVSSAWKKGFASFSYSSQLERENNKNQDDPLSPKSPLLKFTDKQYLSILQSMGESLHIIDIHGRIVYWNPMAETLYGYSAPEALGQNATELIVDAHDFELASSIIQKITMGNSWKGHLPVKNKVGDRFLAISTNTPLYDEDGSLVGIICVSSDSKIFQEMLPSSSCGSDPLHKLSFVSQQPLQAAIASTISNLATKVSQVTNKVRLNLRTGENSTEREGGNGGSNCSDIGLSDSIHSGHREDANSSQASPLREEVSSDRFDVLLKGLIGEKPAGRSMTCSTDEGEEKTGFHKTITSKAEAWIAKKGISWPWKVHEHNELDKKIAPFIFPWSNHDQENDTRQHLSTDIGAKPEHQAGEGYHQTGTNEPLGSWSSCNFSSTSSAGSSGSTNSTAIHKLDVYSDYLDCEILWEDLLIREQIGQGSCGTVYHALWNGTDVAVKVFSKHEYSEDVILSFRQEVSLMKRLRHPNIVLFMGVVTSPQRLCIVTEFLPRGSLFRIIQRSASKLDWRRRIHMALDIARGMNYLHHCNPPIIHHDLKSSNLLVDMNWNVKVSDFGLSRLKGESYITKKTDKGTPQWMAPEILCDEPSDEKSDVYSFGVILWELVTEKIPWENLNSVEVIGAVGFMHHQLDIPNNLDPQWVSIIESCWNSDPQQRPTFQEVLDRLKDMQRRYLIQFQATRLANGERARKMSET